MLVPRSQALYPGEGYLLSPRPVGGGVHQVLSNYQQWPNGGSGWLRLLQFEPSEDRITLQTFDVHTRQRNKTSELELAHCMHGPPSACQLQQEAGVTSRWYSSEEAPGGAASLPVL